MRNLPVLRLPPAVGDDDPRVILASQEVLKAPEYALDRGRVNGGMIDWSTYPLDPNSTNDPRVLPFQQIDEVVKKAYRLPNNLPRTGA